MACCRKVPRMEARRPGGITEVRSLFYDWEMRRFRGTIFKCGLCVANEFAAPPAVMAPATFRYKTTSPRYNLNQLRTIQRLCLMRDAAKAIS